MASDPLGRCSCAYRAWLLQQICNYFYIQLGIAREAKEVWKCGLVVGKKPWVRMQDPFFQNTAVREEPVSSCTPPPQLWDPGQTTFFFFPLCFLLVGMSGPDWLSPLSPGVVKHQAVSKWLEDCDHSPFCSPPWCNIFQLYNALLIFFF